MDKEPFWGAKLKIERAEKHIFELESMQWDFISTNTYTFFVEKYLGKDYFLGIQFEKPLIPEEFGVIVGDILHNLKSALDLMAWELIGRTNGRQHQSLYFPIRKSVEGFKSACEGIDTPHDAVKKFFSSFEAYPDGKGLRFHFLHRLNILDKHQTIVSAQSRCEVSNFTVFEPGSDEVEHYGISSFTINPEGKGNIIKLGGEKDRQIKFQKNTQVSMGVVFPHIDVLPGERILPALINICQDVTTARKRFIDFFLSGGN